MLLDFGVWCGSNVIGGSGLMVVGMFVGLVVVGLGYGGLIVNICGFGGCVGVVFLSMVSGR